MNKNSDLFNLLRKISFKSSLSQREMAKDLGFSLGKLNYCVRALNQKEEQEDVIAMIHMILKCIN